MRRHRKHSDRAALAAKVKEAEATGQLALERDEVTEVLDLACERLRSTTAGTSSAIESTLRSTLPPPEKAEP